MSESPYDMGYARDDRTDARSSAIVEHRPDGIFRVSVWGSHRNERSPSVIPSIPRCPDVLLDETEEQWNRHREEPDYKKMLK